MTIEVAGFDWNCPQHIPALLDAEDVQREIGLRDEHIAELERRLSDAVLRMPSAPPAQPTPTS